MSGSDKKDNSVKSDIPESAFEEALRAVESLAKKKPTGGKSPTITHSLLNDDDIESDADDLDSLLSLLDKKGKPKQTAQKQPSPNERGTSQTASPKPASGSGVYQIPEEDELDIDQLLGNDDNVEKEAEFFRSVLFGDEEPAKAQPKPQQREEAKAAAPTPAANLVDGEQVQELNDRIMRLQAEFENYRKRVSREALEAKKFYNERLMLSLLPIVDNFERAITHMREASDQESMLEGVQLIYRQILGMLEADGMSAMDTDGEKFNPLYHEAVAMVYNPDLDSNTILSEYETGYLLNGRLLRPAKVLVSTNDRNQAAYTDPEYEKKQSDQRDGASDSEPEPVPESKEEEKPAGELEESETESEESAPPVEDKTGD